MVLLTRPAATLDGGSPARVQACGESGGCSSARARQLVSTVKRDGVAVHLDLNGSALKSAELILEDRSGADMVVEVDDRAVRRTGKDHALHDALEAPVSEIGQEHDRTPGAP